MLRWVLLHAFVLIAFLVLTIVLKLTDIRKVERLIKAGLLIPVELVSVMACILGSSLIATLIIEKDVDIAGWIMAIGEVLVVAIALLIVSLMSRALRCGAIPKFLFAIAGAVILVTMFLEIKSFQYAYNIMLQWDIMSEEAYFTLTEKINYIDIAQLLLSVTPAAVAVIYFIVSGLQNKKQGK